MSGKRSRQKRGSAKVEQPRELRPQRPPMRGWLGRGRGTSTYVQQADEWRGTTVQVCGMWPFSIGTGTPMVGVPLGRHIHTGATLCCDPISWFQRAKLISNPSAFVLGKPGLGKSTIVRRMATGLAGYGVMPLVLGDLKPDYVDLIEALGGQVITLGRGRGYLNILDPGEATEAAARLREAGFEKEASQVLADAHGRRHTMVSALLTILRSTPPTEAACAVTPEELDAVAPSVAAEAEVAEVEAAIVAACVAGITGAGGATAPATPPAPLGCAGAWAPATAVGTASGRAATPGAAPGTPPAPGGTCGEAVGVAALPVAASAVGAAVATTAGASIAPGAAPAGTVPGDTRAEASDVAAAVAVAETASFGAVVGPAPPVAAPGGGTTVPTTVGLAATGATPPLD